MGSSSGRPLALKPIHPFPARMAPDIVLDRLADLGAPSRVLDPMVGSGVVLRHALELEHEAIGFDLDPLAVLMSRVWTTPIRTDRVADLGDLVLEEARALNPDNARLAWIDEDGETESFVNYWFGERQRRDLRRLAFVLQQHAKRPCDQDVGALDGLRLALSRLIVTKEPCASLARDTSHSRPHKVLDQSQFEVFPAFERSVRFLVTRLDERPPARSAQIAEGDARSMATVGNETVDAVITSPPYLNAIDYMRGHRLALVWLGYGLQQLRRVRSVSIGAERSPENRQDSRMFTRITDAMGAVDALPNRYALMVQRYAEDIYRMVSEIARVLRPAGVATLVVGNSFLKGTFIRNAAGVREAATMVGLTPVFELERSLPANRRYLPMTVDGQLGRRMRTETICGFSRTA